MKSKMRVWKFEQFEIFLPVALAKLFVLLRRRFVALHSDIL